MKLIVGLGNPGGEYKSTRHNIGFMVIDKLASDFGIAVEKKRYKSLYGMGGINDTKIILCKPQTFMNLSGSAVASMLRAFNLRVTDLIVIYDDMDLDLGKMRIRTKGGSGGHRGVKSIIDAIGIDSFIRCRFGIGRPPLGMNPSEYVLTPFKKEELPVIREVFKRAVDAMSLLVKYDVMVAMNRFNKL
ncbi:MAG: aminoacyl-tRNA hydrolase [Nitrospirae bacterium]|nr:aminoacyl-tRNA hydrolase [Nitrospirota bacterium]